MARVFFISLAACIDLVDPFTLKHFGEVQCGEGVDQTIGVGAFFAEGPGETGPTGAGYAVGIVLDALIPKIIAADIQPTIGSYAPCVLGTGS